VSWPSVPLITGHPDDPRPVNHVLPAWDLLTGAYAAFSLVSALLARGRDGKGREVRLPLSDIAASTLANLGLYAESTVGEGDRPRMGNDLFGAFGRDFVTADGVRIMMVAITPRQWKGIQEVLGIAPIIAVLEDRLSVDFAADEGLRFAHRHELFPIFEAAFGAKSLAELKPVFDALGVCWGPYQPLSAAAKDPRLYAGNPVFADIAHPSGLTYAAPGFAGTMPQDLRETPRRAARLGEHTDEVLADVLKLSAAEIGRLHDAKIVAGPEGA